jgi:hypothetical protein
MTKKSLIGPYPYMLQAPFFYLNQNGRARRRAHSRPAGDFVEGAKTAYTEIILIKATASDAGRCWKFLE